MPSLVDILKKREGYRLDVYLDSRRRPTVGIGHLVTSADKLKVGDKIDDGKAMEFFHKDSAKAAAAAKAQASRAKINDATFIAYLGSVNFQLGTKWTKTFKKTWALIMDGKYAEAAKEVQKSAWFRQTPVRVKDFQRALLGLPDSKG